MAMTPEASTQPAVTWWREKLADLPPMCGVPTDRGRPPGRAFLRGTLSVADDSMLVAASPGDAADVSRAAVLRLAALHAVLARYTLQEDIVILAAVRSSTGSGPLFLRTQLDDDPTAGELTSKVEATLEAAVEHASIPWEEMRALVEPGADRNEPWGLLYVDDVLGEPGDRRQRSRLARRCDLVVTRAVAPDGVATLEIEYDAEVYEEESIRAFARCWSHVLGDITHRPDRPLSEVAMIDPGEMAEYMKRSLAVEPAGDVACVHRSFEEQVRRSPDAVAVTVPAYGAAQRQVVTYDELNRRANRLARHLQLRGAGRGALVGIHLDRGLDVIVAIIATLKAGAAYVPVEPSQPPSRIAEILDDADVVLVLTTALLGERLPSTGREVVFLDTERDPISMRDDSNLDEASETTDLAYVIYTSGSTGRPKGALVTHANVARLFVTTEPHFDFAATDVWTLFHSYSFDFSVWEMWGALLYGGRLVVVVRALARSPSAFRGVLAAEGVTMLNQTPSAFQHLAAADAETGLDPLSLRCVVFGGEALSPSSLREWIDRHGDEHPRLVNMYGITETTVHVTYRRVTAADVRSSRSMIGVPLPDLQLFILDGAGSPVPDGVAGEMYVGGGGVSDGYLNRPELTRERFRADVVDGVRLYRTGDLGRRTASGQDVEYMGRRDQQVKIRGFRIELGEIASVLREHPAVAGSVARVAQGPQGNRQIVAYFTREGDHLVDAVTLRAHAARRLPDYMVPSAYVPLDVIPLTANGKLDTNALPVPSPSSDAGASGTAAPPTPGVEREVGSVYEEVLGSGTLGREDNFFELGGDSLLVITLVKVLRERLGVEVEPVDIFQHPTIRSLARRISRDPGQGESMPEIDERASRRRGAVRRRVRDRDSEKHR